MAKKTVSIKLKLSNCTDCPYHQIRADPDPRDWFNDDDVKVICTKTKRQDNEVAVACRPYNVSKEATIPSWCPL